MKIMHDWMDACSKCLQVHCTCNTETKQFMKRNKPDMEEIHRQEYEKIMEAYKRLRR